MDTRNLLLLSIAAVSATAFAAQQPVPAAEPFAFRILRMNEADQVSYINSRLDRGLATGENDGLVILILNRSSLVLPIIEKKIEEVLRSTSPLDCFTDKTVDPQKFVDVAAWSIPSAGDEYALRAVSKLIAIDEKRFGMLVRNTLLSVHGTQNPFTVAYRGFGIGDPAIDKRIIAWIGPQFDDDSEFRQGQLKHWWAEAMLDKYGRVPNEADWANDPIASRLTPALAASLHCEILRLAAETFEKQTKK